MTTDKALDLALEKVANALPAYIEGTPAREYLAVIHSALAAPVQPVQQEPTAKHTDQFESARVGDYNRGWNDCLFASGIVKQPAPVQEPVAYLCENAVGHKYFRWKKPSSEFKPIALYTTPPAQPAPVQEPVAGQPLPCPFCGHVGLDFSDGETYRWGVASCGGCGASCGDVRREYPDQGEWHNEAIAEWNRRSPTAPDLQAELDATNRQVEILSDALAESRRQRQWVGIEEKDMPTDPDPMYDHKYFIAGMVYADNVLMEKNK